MNVKIISENKLGRALNEIGKYNGTYSILVVGHSAKAAKEYIQNCLGEIEGVYEPKNQELIYVGNSQVRATNALAHKTFVADEVFVVPDGIPLDLLYAIFRLGTKVN